MNYLEAIVTLFAIVDPIGNIPVFMQATEHFTDELRQKSYNVAVMVAIIILLVFAVAGNAIMKYVFHIQMADLQIAGGILLIIIAIKDLVFSTPKSLQLMRRSTSPMEIGCVPMACPLLAGPGAMVTCAALWQNPDAGPKATLVAIAVVLIGLRLIMRYIDTVSRILGKLIITAISKIMLVFIASIGVHMVIEGLKFYFLTTK